MPKCKKCAAAIRFIKMQSGKYMPVDPDKKPYREGGSEIFITDDGEMIRGHSPFGLEPVNGYAYTPHWATCPDAAEFRREP